MIAMGTAELLLWAGLWAGAIGSGIAFGSGTVLLMTPHVRAQRWADALRALAEQRMGTARTLLQAAAILLTLAVLSAVTTS